METTTKMEIDHKEGKATATISGTEIRVHSIDKKKDCQTIFIDRGKCAISVYIRDNGEVELTKYGVGEPKVIVSTPRNSKVKVKREYF